MKLLMAYLVFIGFIILFMPFAVNSVVEIRTTGQDYANSTDVFGETIFGDTIEYEQLSAPNCANQDWLSCGTEWIGYVWSVMLVTSTISWVNFLIIIPMVAGLIYALIKLLKPDWL